MKKDRAKEKEGFFGEFGGRYSPEVLMPAILQLEEVYARVRDKKRFKKKWEAIQKDFIGRPSLLTFAERLSNAWGARIYLKREDLNHTGAHKINNAMGQALLALEMGKERIIAETGAGQHGVATATAAAHFGLKCTVYMGSEDVRRQKLNCYRMKLLGAELIAVESGTRTLKDATNEAMRDWARNVQNTHYVIGSAIGPHPFPTIVRDFQSVIGFEARKQMKKMTGKLPDSVVACVGGGSNAIGIFHAFEEDRVDLYGVEAGGLGDAPGENSATISFGEPGYFHGTRSLFIQRAGGQIQGVHSVSAGLDYPGVGPEHAYLARSGRAKYVRVSDKSALESFREVSTLEGIIPALESAHALSFAKELAKASGAKARILVNLSGRGDKDVAEAASLLGLEV
jgi:tryptophan synthase beta chain